MKTAILGGSFDPVHYGHSRLAETVLADTKYQRVLFIPAASPPHKSISDGATASHRLQMLNLALGTIPGIEIWDGELSRAGNSYTIDTVRELKESGWIVGRPGLIIGDDLLPGLGAWRESEALLREVELIVARRKPEFPEKSPSSSLMLENELWPYSSTEVRAGIRNGSDLSKFLHPEVARYIRENHLYGYSG